MTANDLAQQGDYQGAVLAFVKEKGPGVSFAEISRFLEPYIRLHDDLAFVLPGDPTIILWSGMSEAFCRVMNDLISSKALTYTCPNLPSADTANEAILQLSAGKALLPVVFDLPTDSSSARE